MKFVWILTKEIEYQWTTYHFIHGVYESEELADKALSERVKQYGGDEDDYGQVPEVPDEGSCDQGKGCAEHGYAVSHRGPVFGPELVHAVGDHQSGWGLHLSGVAWALPRAESGSAG